MTNVLFLSVDPHPSTPKMFGPAFMSVVVRVAPVAILGPVLAIPTYMATQNKKPAQAQAAIVPANPLVLPAAAIVLRR